MVMMEGMEYQEKQGKTVLFPEEFCSIIVDGVDQSTFGLPKFVTESESEDERGRAVKICLTGLLEHKKPAISYLYTVKEEHKTGANHVLETIDRFIFDLAASGLLLPMLYVQVYNCKERTKIDKCLRVWSFS